MKHVYMVAALALGGCQGLNFDDLSKLAIADVKAAHASAQAWNDPLAVQCWGFLVTVIPDAKPTKVIGFATGYQKLRNIRRVIQIKDTDAFKIACSPMIRDSRSFIVRLVTGF